MKKKLIFIIIIVVILASAGAAAFFLTREKFQYNEETATGNTPGNLNNGGLFCEYEGVIYFANPYDNNRLYSMKSDCSEVKKLNETSVASLNVFGKYIYYAKNNYFSGTIGVVFKGQLSGVYRCKLDGSHETALFESPSGIINLDGNYLYYQNSTKTSAITLERVKIDGSETVVMNESECNPASIFEHNIYYSKSGKTSHIYILDTKTSTASAIISESTQLAEMHGEYLYYIDTANMNSLNRMKPLSKSVQTLSKEHCYNFNLFNDKIFFTKEVNNTGLYRMNLDGSNVELVTSGEIANICCTSQYTFFQYYDRQGIIYRVPTSGKLTVPEEFHP